MRYLLFGGDYYYARGGCNDLLGAGNSIDDLEGSAIFEEMDIDWYHIYDLETKSVVASSEQQAHGN